MSAALAPEGSADPMSSPRRPGLAVVLASLAAPMLLVFYRVVAPDGVELSNYLPLHNVFETFSIAVAALIFAIGWNASAKETAPALLVLCAGFLGVALLDFGHLYAYKGMPDFITPSGPEKAIAFWFAARFMAAAALLGAALLPWYRGSGLLRLPLLTGVLLVTGGVYWVVLWRFDWLPRTYSAERGLTELKVAGEYVLVGLYVAAAAIFHHRRHRPARLDLPRLTIAAVAIALGEMCFTLYIGVYDAANAAGHIYKVIGYWYLYRAVFVTLVHHPYEALNRSQGELWREKERARVTLLSIGDGLVVTDTDGRVTMMNPVAERLTGWSFAEAEGRPVTDVFVIADARSGEDMEVPVARVLERGEPVGLVNHTVLTARDGRRSHIADMASPIRDRDGRLYGVVMVFQDVTERYRSREALRDSLSLNKGILDSAACGIIAAGQDGTVRVFNREAERIFGYPAAEMLGTRNLPLLHDPDELRVEAERLSAQLGWAVEPGVDTVVASTRVTGAPDHREWIGVRKDGTRIAMSLSISLLHDSDGEPRGYLGVVMDITEKKRAARQIEQLAYYDPLTGLPNRRLLLKRLERRLRAARESGRHGALLFLDLDDFKRLNDARGHVVGDRLLRALADRLVAMLSDGDLVGRLSGDEFVILLPDLGSRIEAEAAARRVADRIRLSAAEPFQLDGWDYSVFVSIGLTVFPKGEDETVEDLLKQADTAMYAAKDAGRNTVRPYDPSMLAGAEFQLRLQQDLRRAVEAGDFTLFLQPQTRADGTLVGAEALVRWRHPERGLVAPGAFIGVAEASGLILPLGDWILMEACRVLGRLEEAGCGCRLSVNISPRQFRQPGFCGSVIGAVRAGGVDPRRLTLEVTEGVAIDDCADTVAKMVELATSGIAFSLDDFGTGFSSLSYLKQLPVEEIKIDRSFVQDVGANSRNAALVEMILSIAARLELKTVAEGVETAADCDFLRERGCAVFQGYYFGRPMPVDEFLKVYAAPIDIAPLDIAPLDIAPLDATPAEAPAGVV